MGKYGRDAMGVDYKVMPAEPGTNVIAELRGAEEKKVRLAIDLAQQVVEAMRSGDYDTAIDKAQLTCTAIVHAGNVANIIDRFGPCLSSPSEGSDNG